MFLIFCIFFWIGIGFFCSKNAAFEVNKLTMRTPLSNFLQNTKQFYSLVAIINKS